MVLPEDNPRIRPEQIAVLIVLVRFSVTVFVGIFDFVIIDYTVICIACCDFYKSSAFVVMIVGIAFKTAVLIRTALQRFSVFVIFREFCELAVFIFFVSFFAGIYIIYTRILKIFGVLNLIPVSVIYAFGKYILSVVLCLGIFDQFSVSVIS